MRIKIASLFCVAAFLMLIAGTVGAWDTGKDYSLHSNGTSPSIAVRQFSGWADHSVNQHEYLRVPGVVVWDTEKYTRGNNYYQGNLRKTDFDPGKKVNIAGVRGEAWINAISSGTAGTAYASRYEPKAVPETSTMIGFGAALALNGLGIAGSKYYLKRRYNRITAQRYARRHISKLSMFTDLAMSITVLLVVSPLLVLVTAKGALISGKPVMFK